MDKKHLIIIIILIMIIAALLCSMFILFNSQKQVHTIDVGVGTFNCSNNINFTLNNSENGYYEYTNENSTYTVKVVNFSESDSAYAIGYNLGLDKIRTYPSSTIDGIIIYNSTANVGEHIGELRHVALIDNNDENISIQISTPSVDETVLIANTFKFN